MGKKRASFLSPEWAFSLFDSLIENQAFSRILLVSSIAGLAISLSVDWGSFAAVMDNFKIADLYKISLFVSGISPYSSEIWLAPYPPFYFIAWAPPYLLFSNLLHLSKDQIYFAFRVLLTMLSALCGVLIYKQLVFQGFSKEKSISLYSVFILCSLTGLIQVTGDFLGLAFLAIGCLFLLKKNTIVALVFVSVSVAFKLQPIFGLVVLLFSLTFFNWKNNKRRKIFEQTASVAAVGAVFGIIPIFLIPGAFSSFVLYDASRLQYYTFSVYSGLYDVLFNTLPSAWSGSILHAVDIAWIIASVSAVVLLFRVLWREKLLGYADPIDLMSLGIMVWLIVLKQTIPYYFLWALLPLLIKGRTRSVALLMAGEFFGTLFFGLGYLFPIPTPNVGIPDLDSSVCFLIGGTLFAFFLIFSLNELLKEMRKQKRDAYLAGTETLLPIRLAKGARAHDLLFSVRELDQVL